MANNRRKKDLRQGPLAGQPENLGRSAAEGLSLSVIGFQTILNLRGNAGDGRFTETVQSILKYTLPVNPNTWSGDRQQAILWLGPDEWLIIAPEGNEDNLLNAFRSALPGDPRTGIVNLSHSYSGLLLSGTRCREVLAGGCPLALSPEPWQTRTCAQSLLAKAPALFRTIDDIPSVEIWVRNSYARYTLAWLQEALAGLRRQT